MKPARILESALYVDDLDRSEAFYRDVLGLSVLTKVEGRHVFFRCGDGVLLLFDPSKTVQAPAPDARLPVPPHGAGGDGHLCFGATEREIEQWKKRLAAAGVAIEADFEWPQGGRSIYFRDPAGNSIEFANPRIWGIPGRRIEGDEIVVASHNKGKLAEIADLIGPFGLTARSAAEHGLPEPEETGTTFEENAYIKAFAAAEATGLPALSDDSGLCVDALDGAPGVYTADWATQADGSRDFGHAMRTTQDRLVAAGALSDEQRQGRFVSVICLAWPDGHAEYFRGEVAGTLVWPPRGDRGFGYDPMFRPEGFDVTFGEMSAAEKHGWKPGGGEPLSHRARAFAKFASVMLDRP
jgi:XTP/dITP diphosphohydrolase